MKVTINNKTLIIEIPIKDPPSLSASGKTLLIASTHGNFLSQVKFNGKQVTVSANAFIHANNREQ